MVAFPLCALAQLSTNIYYNGYWGEWKKQYYTYTKQSWYQIYGNYSKEERKNHRKNNIWYEYTGIVEYSVNSDYPTIKDALKSSYTFPCVKNGDGYKKTARATIKIAPYKDYPQVYNIWFEDVGIAIDLGAQHF